MKGVSKGKVMCTKRSQVLAPSIAQASYSAGGIVCRPARSEIATNGTPRQTLAAIVEKRALYGSPRKSIGWSITPSQRSVQEITENCASYSHQKASADSAVGTIHGKSTTARSSDLNGRW